ncbi:uncharacterized protein H6S33_007882 [Morchella sextelata]|uniref:uncharacterized protein n=1 Tax=Morchella sextelata TaxID=1174677 RepID=UPI001D045C9B|nr:uncharacterized protein H6S33_007882 [Morchella sextelata]KAH0603560.1 hypothetical protein H6S33_007882 [Morchella sextelata]
MDPLSVSASIVGLATTAAHITTTLCHLTMDLEDSPSLVGHIIAEIALINPAMCNLQMFLVGDRRATKSQESMILVEDLVVILTGCVCTFSELEAEVNGLRSGPDLKTLDRSKWMSRENTIKLLLERLKDHKSSIVLMLGILGW